MSERRMVSSGSPYEPVIGLSRAVRVGNYISIAGTAPLSPDGKTVGVGDAAEQARRCFEISCFIDPGWLVETKIDAVIS
jgi:enamine deaminase RidA (YjgF/YER057c/UK114 family)